MVEVRQGTESDIAGLGPMLARAFADDPVMEYLFKPGPKRAARVATFMVNTARRDLVHGEVTTTDGLHGAALWSAPDHWKLSVAELARDAPRTLLALGTRLPRGLRTLSTIEKVHPKEPHWYLGVLGADPPHQGKGVGSALLQPILDRCDEQGLPAYLESSKERNIPFYARHGFTVIETIPFPNGPTVWGMWRTPR